ncbi:MAG TPA: class I SAM-dependent methyltransferase [Streptosporangiaceae bacterium]
MEEKYEQISIGAGTLSWDYGTLATEVYELDKPIGHSFGDVEYYTRHLAGVTGRVLEPAAGTGRVLIPLLAAGFAVEGLDSSPQMLAVCRQHCRDRGLDPVLREADMTAFVRAQTYQAVIMPAGSITLLAGPDATLRALTAFHQSLAPGGRLILDVPATRRVAETEPMRHWRRDSCLWTLQTMHIEYDRAANQTTRFLRYEKWRDGGLLATELQIFRLQHWSLPEFGQLLGEAGFTDVRVTADYHDTGAPGPDSDDWTFHATRP